MPPDLGLKRFRYRILLLLALILTAVGVSESAAATISLETSATGTIALEVQERTDVKVWLTGTFDNTVFVSIRAELRNYTAGFVAAGVRDTGGANLPLNEYNPPQPWCSRSSCQRGFTQSGKSHSQTFPLHGLWEGSTTIFLFAHQNGETLATKVFRVTVTDTIAADRLTPMPVQTPVNGIYIEAMNPTSFRHGRHRIHAYLRHSYYKPIKASDPAYHHVMPENGSVTYNVRLMGDSCTASSMNPATVRVAINNPQRWRESPPRNMYWAMAHVGIIAGESGSWTNPPYHWPIDDPEDELQQPPPSTLDLTFTACDTPQSVTIYGVPDGFDRGQMFNVTHELQGKPVVDGPVLKLWLYDRINFGYTLDTPNGELKRGSDVLHFNAPAPDATWGDEDAWTEFCFKLSGSEIPSYDTHRNITNIDSNPLPELHLVPHAVQYGRLFYKAPGIPHFKNRNTPTWIAQRFAKDWVPGQKPIPGFVLPLEFQTYSALSETGCSSRSGGSWQPLPATGLGLPVGDWNKWVHFRFRAKVMTGTPRVTDGAPTARTVTIDPTGQPIWLAIHMAEFATTAFARIKINVGR